MKISKKNIATISLLFPFLVYTFISLRPMPKAEESFNYCIGECICTLDRIGNAVYYLSTGNSNNGFPIEYKKDVQCSQYKITSDTSSIDLIQECLRRGLIKNNDICCPHSRKNFLVVSFPAFKFASIPWAEENKGFMDETSVIPVVIDQPNSHSYSRLWLFIFKLLNHGNSPLTVPVLYSDGSVRTLSKEDAEEIILKYCPIPIE